jgi:ribosomal protein L37E
VPTVEREVFTGRRWSMAIAGRTPTICSTCGFSMRSRNWRAYAEKLST